MKQCINQVAVIYKRNLPAFFGMLTDRQSCQIHTENKNETKNYKRVTYFHSKRKHTGYTIESGLHLTPCYRAHCFMNATVLLRLIQY